jgi:ribonucleoside-diphosphate reductase alpha chain
MHTDQIRLLPNGKGRYANYRCQTSYRLMVSSFELGKLIDLGFKTHRLDLSTYQPANLSTEQFIQVTGVEEIEGKHNTYCFTEPKRNLGMFNGILLGNCAEIIEYSDHTEYGVCNLASISLSSFVTGGTGGTFDFKGLLKVAKIMTENLDKIIDVNHYPIPQTSKSNLRHRPVGLGVQGLADVYNLLGLPFESEEAQNLNRKIFATIYYGALSKSVERAQQYGRYSTFENSPFSQGKVQFDLEYDIEPECVADVIKRSDWDQLKEKIKKHGTRNSLLTTCMPTASTSQILKNNECIEPFTSNVFVRKTLAGEYIIVNEHLVNDCSKAGIWNKELYQKILHNNGSVQDISEIPQSIKSIYKTAYELKMSDILKQAIGRAPYIDQSQSMNLFQANPDFAKLHSSHFYAWKNGLKTGMYYLRTQPVVNAIKFGISQTGPPVSQEPPVAKKEPLACSRLNPNCEACSG